jgi:signal transduction histidine kinase
MFKGEVMPNPLFISPSTIGEGEKPFEVFLNQTLNRTSISKGKIHNFPTNLPNLLESILDSVPIGIVAGDIYGNMVFFNKEAIRIMGLPASPLPYAERIRRFGNFLPDKKTPYPFEDLPLSRAIRGEVFEGVPLFINRPELERGVMVECNGRGMYDADGTLLGGVVIFHDITALEEEREEKKNLEGRLLQSQKMESLGLMAGGIAHDFNNLLVGVLGNASVLLQTEALSSPYRKRLMQIQDAGTQLAELTKQLLIYAGLSPAKDLEKDSLTSVVKVMSGLLETAVSKRINLSFDLSTESLWILMEPTQLKQVLLNLVVNASDSYKGTEGSILLSVCSVREF